MTNHTVTLHGQGFAFDTTALSGEVREYLVRYALGVIGNRETSGLQKKLKSAGKSDAEILAACIAKVTKRFDALRAGQLVTGKKGPRGPRLTGFDRWLRRTMTAALEAKLKRAPKPEEVTALIEKAIARNADWLDVQRIRYDDEIAMFGNLDAADDDESDDDESDDDTESE